jgi:hypothetical protein
MKRLKDIADVGQAQPRHRLFSERRDLDPVQPNGSGCRSVEPRNQTQECGLPAPGRPDNRHRLLFRNVYRDIVKNGHPSDRLRPVASSHAE